MQQQTLAIIKPDGVARNLIGEIIGRIEAHGLRIQAMKMIHLSKTQAEAFYAVHRERPFFQSLTDFMSEGPVVSMILSGENAIQVWRDLMGATDPVKAAPGTIRRDFGQSIERNTTHGSDGQETAAFETAYFFSQIESVN
ncbi:MAG: nucleoside-diphosphate kinase [Acidobacteria bacterium]|nr:MAG: nucleoside-diphosphate kinase [Acidobacteriota bacterium]PYU97978.1 MAG: nucleoside-diphosphate kinase [Acidobacteriota bacterium]PYV36907.1 MAG: nucleoside-diphosphate kinase [Acidobacteriota bacterium]